MSKAPVYIEWIDACGPAEGGWITPASAALLTPSVVKCVGWVIKSTRTHVILAGSRSPASVDGVTCIPRVCITRQVKMPVPKK